VVANLVSARTRNAEWNGFGGIDVELEHPEYGWIPFTANPHDELEHGRELFRQLSEGLRGPVAEVNQQAFDEKVAFFVRLRRNGLLAATDWSQLADVSSLVRTAWAEYRQALRDVPQQPGFPGNVVWPEPPFPPSSAR
jgi:hypothetical protein